MAFAEFKLSAPDIQDYSVTSWAPVSFHVSNCWNDMSLRSQSLFVILATVSISFFLKKI